MQWKENNNSEIKGHRSPRLQLFTRIDREHNDCGSKAKATQDVQRNQNPLPMSTNARLFDFNDTENADDKEYGGKRYQCISHHRTCLFIIEHIYQE